MPPTNQMQKQRAKIVAVDPTKRTVHGELKDKSNISIAVFEVPSNFRWPDTGEIWTIYRENQYWMLGSRVHTQIEDYAVEDMEVGELRLDSDNISDSRGHKIKTMAPGEAVVSVSDPSLVGLPPIPDGNVVVYENGEWTTTTIDPGPTTPSGPASGDLTGYYPNPTFGLGRITGLHIANNAGIPYSKLSLTNGIRNSDIVANTITANLIAANTITANEIMANTITANEILANTITANQIAANTITANEILANTITAGEIAASAITADEIAAGTITAYQIAAETITAGLIAVNTITAGQIASNTITAAQIAASTITATQIAASTITAGQIAANTITSGQIAANTITANEIEAGAITAVEINASSIRSAVLTANSITSAMIQSSAIQADQISADSVTANKLVTVLQVSGSSIVTGGLSALTSNMGSISAGTITGGTVRTSAGTARVQMDSSGIFAKGLDGVDTFRIDAGTGNVTLKGSLTTGSTVPATSITGQIVTSQITDAAITDTKVAALAASKITGQLTNSQLEAIAAAKVSGQLTNSQLADIAATKISGTLTDSQIAGLSATKISGTLTNAQIADLAATKITGQLVDSQLAGISTTKLSGQVTDAQVAALSASKVTGQLTDSQLAAISAAKVTGTLAGSQIADAAITAVKIGFTIGGGNRVTNSGPLTDTNADGWADGWASYVGAITPVIDTDAPIGLTRSQKGTWDGTSATLRIRTPFTTVGMGVTVVCSAWIKAPVGRTLSIAAFSGPGSTEITTFASLSAQTATGSWQRVVLSSATITSTHDTVGMKAGITSPQAGDVIRVAGAQVEIGEVATAYAPKPDEILPNTITATEISDNSVTTPKLITNAVTAAKIAANTITATQIAASTITATEIAGATITGAKIAAGTIAASNILAATITSAEVAADTLTAGNIAANAITTSELAAGAVTAAKITAATITSNEIASATIVAGNIAALTITASQIAALTITGGKIAANTITATNIAADTITAGEIAANAITSSELAAGAVTAGKITAGTIVAADIAALTITGAKIAANTITATNIVADTITANEIAASAITTSELAAGAVTAAKIVANTITAGQIAALTITAAEIATNTIVASKIAIGTLTANEIGTGALTANVIRAGAITADKLSIGLPLVSPLRNGNFAEGGLADGTVLTLSSVGWVSGGGNAPTVQTDTTFGRTARLVNATGANSYFYQSPPMPTGRHIVRGWVKTTTVLAGSGLGAYINLEPGTATCTITDSAAITGTTDWTLLEAVVNVTVPGTVIIYLQLYNTGAGSSGTAEFANISIDSAISNTVLAPDSITTDKILTGTILASDISASSITAIELTAGNARIGMLKTGAVDAVAVKAGAIDASKITVGIGPSIPVVNGNFNALNSDGTVPTDGSTLGNGWALVGGSTATLQTDTTWGRVAQVSAPSASTTWGQNVTVPVGLHVLRAWIKTSALAAANAFLSATVGTATATITPSPNVTGTTDWKLCEVTISVTVAGTVSLRLRVDAASTGIAQFANVTLDTAITTTSITPGAITTATLAANSITADKIGFRSGGLNLLKDGGFEGYPIGSTIGGYGGFGSGTWSGISTNGSATATALIVATDSGQSPHGGTKQMKWVLSTAGQLYCYQTATFNNAESYTISVWIKATAGTGATKWNPYVQGSYISSGITRDNTPGTDGTIFVDGLWHRYSYTFVGNATAGEFHLYGTSHTVSGVTLYFDDGQIELGEIASGWTQFIDPTVIDGATVTGATIRTALGTGNTARVEMTTTGLSAYDGTVKRAYLDTSGNLSLWGADGITKLLDFSGGSLSIIGTLNVTAGASITGTLGTGNIPSLDAAKITSGTLPTAVTVQDGSLNVVSTSKLSGTVTASTIITPLSVTTGLVAANQITADKINFRVGGRNLLINSTWANGLVAPWTGTATETAWMLTSGSTIAAYTDTTLGPAISMVTAGTYALEGTWAAVGSSIVKFRAGVKYTFSAYLRASASAGSLALALGATSGDSAIGATVPGAVAAANTGTLGTTWQRYYVTWTPIADVTADQVEIGVRTVGTTAATYYVSRTQVEEGDVPSDWAQYIDPTVIDGSTVQGAVIRTAASGSARVEMNGPNNKLSVYSASGEVIKLDGTTGIRITPGTGTVNNIDWHDGTSLYSSIAAYLSGSDRYLYQQVFNSSGAQRGWNFMYTGATQGYNSVGAVSPDGSVSASVNLTANSSNATFVGLQAGTINLTAANYGYTYVSGTIQVSSSATETAYVSGGGISASHGNIVAKSSSSNATMGDSGHGATYAAYGHGSAFTTTGYALLSASDGTTYLNCASGKNINFRTNNTQIMTMSVGGLDATGVTITAGVLVSNGKVSVSASSSGYSWWEYESSGVIRAINSNGGNYATIKGYINNVSDPTQKTTMELIENTDDVLTAVRSIDLFTHGFKNSGGMDEQFINAGGSAITYGVDAAQVQEVMPAVVMDSGEEGGKGIYIMGLVSAMLVAIQELTNKVEALEQGQSV